MERINYNSLRFLEFIDSLNPRNSGIFFSILLHLIILLSAVGLPNFFGPKDIYVPNIIPIEILNVSETTNIKKTESQNETSENTSPKQKKFNSSNNTEIQKKFEITENVKTINENDQSIIEIKEKDNQLIEEKKNIEIKQKENIKPKTKIETLKSTKIKPKIKPKTSEVKKITNTSDVNIEPKIKNVNKEEQKKIITKPKPKPKEDFSIASMLKDLRNEKSNNVIDEENKEDEQKKVGEDNQNENMVLSISEIDLLRQQLSSCWNAPAGAVINIGDKVTISAKVQQNMEVYQNSVQIVDTNISKSNPFYGPITDSAMRTLLNPECTPLKLPINKYKLWKNLTITFDYSIMKGY
tara:strand:- start:1244 stop:2302 length:1059 start_codon:yes stop_codon:yes gene_type:complete